MLDIIVVGGGIAGLAAAISLRRSGHRVRIYERGSFNSTGGAAITVPGNAERILSSWGIGDNEFEGTRGTAFINFDPGSMDVNHFLSFEKLDASYGSTYKYAHRADLHRELRRVAFSKEGAGLPVVAHGGCSVKAFNPDTPSITLANGEVLTADAVIATDGVHSLAPSAIMGQHVSAVVDKRYSMIYRFMLHRDQLASTDETAFWLKQDPGAFVVLTDTKDTVRLIMYTCRGGTLYNFGIFFSPPESEVISCSPPQSPRSPRLPRTPGSPASTASDTSSSYQTTDFEPVVEILRNYHPLVHATVRLAKNIKRFPILCREPLPTWKKGKMVVAGDAAHAMLPLLGQGAAQAIEDGAVLGAALAGATRDTVDSRLTLFERLRRERATAVQIMSRVGLGNEDQSLDDWNKFLPGKEYPKNPKDIFDITHGFDLLGQVEQEVALLEKATVQESSCVGM